MRLFPLVVISIFFQSLGNVLLGKGIKQATSSVQLGWYGLNLAALEKYIDVGLAIASNGSFSVGLLLLIAFFLLHLAMLSKADLSFVMPVTSFSYVLIAILAGYLLNERISIPQWIGILLISIGVMIVGFNEAARRKRVE